MDRTCSAPDPSGFPDGESDKRYLKYKAIDKDGICRVGEPLESGFYMVNKESPMDTSMSMGGAEFGLQGSVAVSQIQYKPTGMSYRGGAPVYVDKVLITSNENEQFLVKVCVRQTRAPRSGDKFASRHGHKREFAG
jgi:DNA-directed RNA polymerase III subunit RPC2